MKRLLLVLVLALASVHGLKELAKKCPTVVAKQPFDVSKYAGRWYIVAGLPFSADGIEDGECVTYEIAVPSDSGPILTTLKYVQNNTAHTEQMYSQIVPTHEATVHIIGDYGAGTWGEIFQESVVVTDYDHYAVLIGCRPIFDTVTKKFGRELYADIASRTTSLDGTIMNTLKNVISSYDIDATKVVNDDNSNCNYN